MRNLTLMEGPLLKEAIRSMDSRLIKISGRGATYYNGNNDAAYDGGWMDELICTPGGK